MKHIFLILVCIIEIISLTAPGFCSAADDTERKVLAPHVYYNKNGIIHELHYDGATGSFKLHISEFCILVEDQGMSVTEENGIRTYTGKNVTASLRMPTPQQEWIEVHITTTQEWNLLHPKQVLSEQTLLAYWDQAQ